MPRYRCAVWLSRPRADVLRDDVCLDRKIIFSQRFAGSDGKPRRSLNVSRCLQPPTRGRSADQARARFITEMRRASPRLKSAGAHPF